MSTQSGLQLEPVHPNIDPSPGTREHLELLQMKADMREITEGVRRLHAYVTEKYPRR